MNQSGVLHWPTEEADPIAFRFHPTVGMGMPKPLSPSNRMLLRFAFAGGGRGGRKQGNEAQERHLACLVLRLVLGVTKPIQLSHSHGSIAMPVNPSSHGGG